ncbi:putative cell wall-binding protein [Clostridium algifaecis]|uniref:Cell wall-binding protein n=1 Tax=Clostridium algifaecis TaxID=1472040 RepID=A0ABS4KQB1_9CLOT|nr:cell wall-binding repeat-containing protein [Clostridium algifaecis]MBP2032224.1 putative cell wall-binding protein [Clostridium algifaecis]
MIRRNKIFSKLVLGIFLAASLSVSVPQSVFAASSRLGGTDRYDTSTKVSQNGWTTSDYVVLASGQGYADALCAAPVAKKFNAPILLTPSGTLSGQIKSEIARLKATHVIIIGGNASVSDAIEKQLSGMSLDVQRFGGKDRYETSAIVASKLLASAKEIVVASGQGYADALSIAPVAAIKGMPILLTSKDAVPDSVKSYIASNKANIGKTYVIGGTGAISDNVSSSLPISFRINGKDRFDTNVSIMAYFASNLKFDNLYIVRGVGPKGNEFADALSAAALAAKNSSAVMLTYGDISKADSDFVKINIKSSSNIVAVGGTAAVPDSVMSTIQQDVSSGSDSSSSSSADADLISAANSLKTIKGLNSAQQSIVDSVVSVIDKHSSDANYDYSSDSQVASVKTQYSALSSDDKTSFKTAIMNSGMSYSAAMTLKNKFGL